MDPARHCDQCGAKFVLRHTCPAGMCTGCLETFKDLRKHRCAVDKFQKAMETLPDHLLEVHNNRKVCDGCSAVSYTHKSSNAFRIYKDATLCAQCYSIPQIFQEQVAIWGVVQNYLFSRGKSKCRVCHIRLLHLQEPSLQSDLLRLSQWPLSPTVCRTGVPFELDHDFPPNKEASVWELVRSGATVATVLAEVDKCSPVCAQCHSAVTATERLLGRTTKGARQIQTVEGVMFSHNTSFVIDEFSRSLRVMADTQHSAGLEESAVDFRRGEVDKISGEDV